MPSIDDNIKEATEILEMISEDQSVPRNIRRAASQSMTILSDEKMDIAVRAVNAIELLDDTTSDPNCPYHARTLIWQAITKLEIPNDDDDDDDYYYDDEYGSEVDEEEEEEDDEDFEYEDDDF